MVRNATTSAPLIAEVPKFTVPKILPVDVLEESEKRKTFLMTVSLITEVKGKGASSKRADKEKTPEQKLLKNRFH